MMLLGEFQFMCPRSVFSLITNYRASEQQTGSKKSKKSNQPPSGLLPGWDRNRSQATSAAPAAGKDIVSTEDDSMVQYGGLLEDEEDDEIEKTAVCKSSFKGGVGKKAMVRSRYQFLSSLDQSQFSRVSSRSRNQSQQRNPPRRKLEMALSNGVLLTSLLELTARLLTM